MFSNKVISTLTSAQWDPKIEGIFEFLYSCVHISSDEVFSKILKKPLIVQKKMMPHTGCSNSICAKVNTY